MATTIAVVSDSAPRESRVALTPPVVAALIKTQATVLVEKGAGVAAGYLDETYADAGATLVTRAKAVKDATVVVSIGRPDTDVLEGVAADAVVIGLLESWDADAALASAAARGVRLIDLARLPREVSRAQTMDVLSSQASIAGYRAAIIAAEAYGRYFPMMVTAAGTAKPAAVLVLGAGVAGLQAIATARRLGARVTGYDVRPAAREEVTSLGAAFLTTSVGEATGDGGYARELTGDEAAQQQQELADAMAKFDIVITTARVPGRKPPLLVTEQTVAAMKRGAVIVDLAASALGGNVAGVVAGERTVTDSGVTIIGADALAADMAPAASDAFAKNVSAVIASMVTDGELSISAEDEVISAMLVTPARAEEGVSA